MSGQIYKIGLAGETRYQDAIARCTPGAPVMLIPEFDNPHDHRAIAAVLETSEKIGYLPRDGWLTEAILEDQKLAMCFIHAIEGEEGRRGVVCDVQLIAGGPDWYEIAEAQGYDLSPRDEEGGVDADEFLAARGIGRA